MWAQIAAGVVLLVVIVAASGGGGGDKEAGEVAAVDEPTTTAEDTTTTTEETTTATEETTTTETLPAVACETPVDSTLNRIAASLEGEPSPTIAAAQTAMFTVEGDQGRIIVVRFAGPGVDGEEAVFAIGPSGTFYAEDGMAQEFSSLPEQRLGPAWNEPIEQVRACLANV